ncbi:MAG: hypothetical protein ABWY58_08780 [Aeromicrobium sp.]
MSSDTVFHPKDAAEWTRGAVRSSALLVLFITAAAVVGYVLDEDWWMTAAGAAVIAAVVAPIAIVQWRASARGRSLVVTDETVVMHRSRSRQTVVRRGGVTWGGAFAPVQRGTGSPASVKTLVVTDGAQTIELTADVWDVATLRQIARLLGIVPQQGLVSRSELRDLLARR